jgi:3-oxoacyl-[acyl-carrier protein] reductase
MAEADFKDRTVLVTGGSRGIGRACCVRLAKAGARVAINYRSQEAEAQETARLVEAEGAQALTVQADVADETSVAAMVARVNDQFGPIDMLVNNAASSSTLRTSRPRSNTGGAPSTST